MEGSIADTTALRIRDQLHSVRQASSGKADRGLFEELLKFSIVQSPPRRDHAPADDTGDDPLPDQPMESAASSSETRSRSDEDNSHTDEATEDQARASAVPAVFVPVVNSAPVTLTAESPTDHLDARTSHSAGGLAGEVHAPDGETAAGNTVPVGVQRSIEQAAAPTGPLPTDNLVSDSASELNSQVVEGPVEGTEQSASRSVRTAKEVTGSSTAEPSADQAAPATQLTQASAREPGDRRTAGTRETSTEDQSSSATPPIDASRAERPSESDGDLRREKWYMGKSEPDSLSGQDAGKESEESEDQEAVQNDPSAASATALQAADARTPIDATSITSGSVLDVSQLNAAAAVDAAAQAALASATVSTGGGTERGSSGPSSVTTSGPEGSSAGAARPVTGSPARAVSSTAPEKADHEVRQLSQQERVRLVQRVARSFSRLGPDGGQITLKLHPPQLGVLNVSVRIEGQTMSAKLQTESSAARDAILENLPVLRERLAEQGVDVSHFQVDVANAGDMTDGRAANSFGGDSSGSTDRRPSDIDYRRLGRNSASSVAQPMLASRFSQSAASLGRGLADRSLDIRA